MSKITDDILMAYVDGELDETQLAEIEKELAQNPELHHRLEIFEKTSKRLASYYNSALNKPIESTLIERIEVTETNNDQIDKDESISQTGYLSQFRSVFNPKNVSNLAALIGFLFILSGTLIFVLTSNIWQTSQSNMIAFSDNSLVAIGDLEHGLEKTKSGEKFEWIQRDGLGVSMEPILTFRNLNGQICREYEIQILNNLNYGGVACRTVKNGWRIVAHTELKRGKSAEKGYTPSNGNLSILDVIVDQIMSGDALDPIQENSLILNKWIER